MMVYERYPRDEVSGDDYRRVQRPDRHYGARDYGAGTGGQTYGDRYQNRDYQSRDGWRGEYRPAGDDQRGYYSTGSAGDLSNRGTRYGGRYGDDYGSDGSYSGYGVGGSGFDRSAYGRGDFARNDRNRYDDGRGDYGRPDMYRDQRATPDYNRDERGFLARAGDEVRSWFGDDEAERRRELDQRYDQRFGDRDGDARDDHYRSWRSGQIAALDRDYDEYRRENRQKFHNEFDTWRTDRQGQRSSLSQVTEHMDVTGSDGEHVGTVDKVRGDRIILTKSDQDAGGRHHSIPSRWIQSVDDKVTLRKTADEAKAAWRDEERNDADRGRGAFFAENDGAGDRDADAGGHILNRSFSGTYR